jgi:hypothetical protein
MDTLDLVTAIINKDAVGVEAAFNSVMAEKISDHLEDMRANIAQNMFADQEVQFENDEDDEEVQFEDDEDEGESIQEVSSELLGRYKEKAKASADTLSAQGKHRQSTNRWMNVMKASGKQIGNTTKKIKTALEEVDYEDDTTE